MVSPPAAFLCPDTSFLKSERDGRVAAHLASLLREQRLQILFGLWGGCSGLSAPTS